MRIKWRIARSGQGGRTPSRFKLCKECKRPLTKYRFEITEYALISTEADMRSRVCPQCVLIAYLNRATFWEELLRFFKPKYNRNEIIEKGGATSTSKI